MEEDKRAAEEQPVVETASEAPPAEETFAPEPEPIPQPAVGASEVEEKPTFGQRVSAFFKRLLVWSLGMLVVFGAGFLVAYTTLYRPMKASWADVSAQNQQLQSQVKTLQGQLDQANQQYEALREQKVQADETIQRLQDEIARLDAQNTLLLAKTNVADARRAIAQENIRPLAKVMIGREVPDCRWQQ